MPFVVMPFVVVFDTPEFELFRWHHAGGRNRYKVRARQYVESRYTFLEVKHKTNKQHTVKSRLSRARQMLAKVRGIVG